jgi:glycosyltransferase involved in cell wall biosynthesis
MRPENDIRVGLEVSSVFETFGGGVGYSTAHLAIEMQKILGQEGIPFFSSLGKVREIPPDGPFSNTPGHPGWKSHRVYRHLYREFLLPGQIKGSGEEVVHFPDTKVPRRMKGTGVAIAVTINDMGAYVGKVPEEHRERHRRAMADAVGTADIIITISDFTKNSLVEILDVDPGKIKTVYLGISDRYRPIEEETWRPFLKTLWGIQKGYFLFIGEVNERKNLLSLTRAHKSLPAHLRKRHPLVIAGRVDETVSKSRGAFINHFLSGIDEFIILTGMVSEEEKLFLYNGCGAMVFPSKYEGFGLPVLEAMACGRAVIAVRSSAIAELHKDKAMMLDQTTPEELGGAMTRIVEDDDLRGKLEKKGKKHAAVFTWEKAARNTIQAYREVLTRSIS